MNNLLIKWVGGKSWLVPTLVKHMPPRRGPMSYGPTDRFRDYYEPFAGGAALFFELARHHMRGADPHRYFLSDANPALVSMYTAVRARPSAVASELGKLVLQRGRWKDTDGHYQRIRNRWNSHDGDIYECAAMFLYLNRTCFNGLWRVNRKGEFNVPVGRYTNPPIYDAKRIIDASTALQCAVITCASAFLCPAGSGDFVYFDPPYDPITATSSFTSYATDGFGRKEQELLAHTADKLANVGAHVMLSNSDTKLIRSLYKRFRIRRVRRPGSMNSNTSKRGKVAELLITSY